MPQFTISNSTYLQLLLHASKHFSEPVTGLLLGSKITNVSSTSTINISHCVPLFHSNAFTLSSNFDLALTLVSTYCDSNSLSIIGVYHSSSSNKKQDLPLAIKIIGETINKITKTSVVLIIDDQKLKKGKEQIAIKAYCYRSKWINIQVNSLSQKDNKQETKELSNEESSSQENEKEVLVIEEEEEKEKEQGKTKNQESLKNCQFQIGDEVVLVEKFKNLLSEEKFRQIVDLEDHLNNPELDFLTQNIN
ncbi:er membrane protein complex [Anaeramoeba flamelloides]|uniref:Er membrane protein complex n=1 Tax=Anaeramoeba flamelloides TaxID=1746091 RepID=A0ABQ8Z0N0_9EUKA|nr:er membrane protein complex [Anaeramoeba flamelloides]